MQEVRVAADDTVGLRVESVELKIESGSYFVQLFEKTVVSRNALAVGVEHDEANVTGLSRANEVDDSGVDGGFATRELNDLRLALGADVVVEHLLDFLQ